MATKTIKVANQDTVEAAQAATWLLDYKTYGTGSYVYINKDIYDELFSHTELVANDSYTQSEALDYCNSAGTVGAFLSGIYGFDTSVDTSGIKTIDNAVSNSTVKAAVLKCTTTRTMFISNDTAWSALASTSAKMKSSAADANFITGLLANSTRLSEVCNSSAKFGALISVSSALSTCLNSSTFINALDTTVAGNEFVSNSTAWSTLTANETALKKILQSSSSIKGVMSTSAGANVIYSNAKLLNLAAKGKHSGVRPADGYVTTSTLKSTLSNTTYFTSFTVSVTASTGQRYYCSNYKSGTTSSISCQAEFFLVTSLTKSTGTGCIVNDYAGHYFMNAYTGSDAVSFDDYGYGYIYAFNLGAGTITGYKAI